jgi:hypothetical protein
MDSGMIYTELFGKCLGCGGEVTIHPVYECGVLQKVKLRKGAKAYIPEFEDGCPLGTIADDAKIAEPVDFCAFSHYARPPYLHHSNYAIHVDCARPLIEIGRNREGKEYEIHAIRLSGKEFILDSKIIVPYNDFRKIFGYLCDRYGLPLQAEEEIPLSLYGNWGMLETSE